ncbi:MAG TPA: hypothetical protein VFB31_15435 [Pseudolabrys sp.]|nr:hypothetical protein [Pseudolabrys sp.]
MTPEQIMRGRARGAVFIGIGIAALMAAYRFATTASPEGPWSPFMPFIFGAGGAICIGLGVFMLSSLRNVQVESAKADVNNPRGTTVMTLFAIGLAALVGDFFADRLPLGEGPKFVVGAVLLIVMLGCFIAAARIVRSSRAATGTSK